MEIAILGLGCFWGPEIKFSKLDGVIKTEVGYCGGHKAETNYKTWIKVAKSINEFRIGVAEGAKGGMKARLVPYFIVLPLAGFFIGKWWGGRKR